MPESIQFYGERPDQALLDQIDEHLSGGVVGCHWAEGFPFYYINDRFLAYTGYTYEEFKARTKGRMINAIHPEDRDQVSHIINTTLRQQDSYQVEYRLQRKDGGWVWLRGMGKRATDHQHRESILSVSIDITESVALRQALERKSQELNSLIDRIPCGLCKVRLDEDLTIQYANEYLYRLFGYTTAQASGIRSGRSLIYPVDWEALRADLRAHQEAKALQFELELRYIHQSGAIRWLLIRFSADPSEPEFFHAAMLDITDRKEMEERLRLSEEEYRIAVDHTNFVIDIYDMSTRTLTQPQAAADLLGFPTVVHNLPDSVLAQGTVASASVGEYTRFFQDINEGKPSGSAVIQVRTTGGCWRWLSGRYTMLFSDSGIPLRAIISYSDITEHREKELAYQKWSQYFETQQEGTIGYYEYNLTRDIYNRSDNPQLSKLSQLPPELGSFTGAAHYIAQHFIAPEDKEEYLRVFDRRNLLLQYYEGTREVRLEHRRWGANGQIIWAMGTIQLIPDPYSSDIKAFALIRDINEEKEQALLLQRLSERDNLTGLYNRRMLVEKISDMLTADPGGKHHAVIMLDIDHFKKLNDSFGHHFGDQVLRDLADRLLKQLRPGDFCGRLGGDEFLVFLHSVREYSTLIPRLESLAKALTLTPEVPASTVTVSMGLAAYPQDGADFDALYQAADAALYKAKRNGRRYAIFQREMEDV